MLPFSPIECEGRVFGNRARRDGARTNRGPDSDGSKGLWMGSVGFSDAEPSCPIGARQPAQPGCPSRARAGRMLSGMLRSSASFVVSEPERLQRVRRDPAGANNTKPIQSRSKGLAGLAGRSPDGGRGVHAESVRIPQGEAVRLRSLGCRPGVCRSEPRFGNRISRSITAACGSLSSEEPTRHRRRDGRTSESVLASP